MAEVYVRVAAAVKDDAGSRHQLSQATDVGVESTIGVEKAFKRLNVDFTCNYYLTL